MTPSTRDASLIGVAMDVHDRLGADGIEPVGLDVCREHEIEGLGYHYHVNATAENQIIGCFAVQTGCTSNDPDAACDASAVRRGPRR